jgi:hypothetical protein
VCNHRIVLLFLLCLALWIPDTSIYGQTDVNRTSAPVVLYDLPQDLSLCGERVPLEKQDVWESLDQALISSVYYQSQVILWIKRAHRYFPYIEKRLKEKNMPDDLKYVVIVESALKTYITSSAKAVGPWQFMNGTGRKYGLRIDKWIDERRHFERATEASLAYFSDLYKIFGNWNLAIAAYNCGENGLARRKGEQESTHFYDTDLPLETEAYIFRILAAKMILSNPAAYGYIIPEARRYPPLQYDQVDIDLAKETAILIIARACDTSFKMIKEMNPEILRDSLPAGHFSIRIPKGKAEKFKAALTCLR